MYAIIATGGKQYTVSEGDVIKVEKLGLVTLLHLTRFFSLITEKLRLESLQ